MTLDKTLLDARMQELYKQYRASVSGKSVNGSQLSPSYCQLVRTTTLKELDTLQLIRCLLNSVSGNVKLTPDAQRGWCRLVEPNKRHGGVGGRAKENSNE